jgi:DegV family protein with EDD domain
MAKVLVMADSVAGIPVELAEQYRIKVVPAANIVFDRQTYVDGVTINAAEAYELLKKSPDKFTTSAVSPEIVLEAYRQLGEQTNDILFVTLSSALSAVIQTAAIAKELYEEEKPGVNIKLLDSKSAASGQGLMTLAAARAAQHGLSLEQTADYAQQVRQSMGCYMLLDTLKYAYRTGRISKTSATIAALFGIKPINRVSDSGTVDYVERVRKREAGVQRIIELIKKEMATDALHFMIMHADALDAAQDVSERLKKDFHALSMTISDYSPVMGYGAGPGALSIGFHPEISLPQ